jgi:cytochrome c-type biogenesis protein CcsB
MSLYVPWSEMPASARWSAVADLLCVVGFVASIGAAFVHARASRRDETTLGRGVSLAASAPFVCLVATLIAMLVSVGHRAIEVNHFPSQTMSEVITMFTTASLLSMTILHFALALPRRGPGWAVVDDVLIGLVLTCAVLGPHLYVQTISTAQRDLPPALQSYWFPPHLSALIFSYGTMIIAGMICLVYFVTRFWSGVFAGGQTKKSQWLIFAGLALVPFAHVVTLPVLAIGGLVFFVLLRMGRLPGAERLLKLEKELDDVSFRAFAVGIPFLTAGLWMGAFWAQEAWANYWGWDSKENSALITWLVYIVYIHLRMLGGYRGAKAMSVLMGGAVSVFITFQLFGYLPDSQKSLHRYTDDGVKPMEGQQGGGTPSTEQARAEMPATKGAAVGEAR